MLSVILWFINLLIFVWSWGNSLYLTYQKNRHANKVVCCCEDEIIILNIKKKVTGCIELLKDVAVLALGGNALAMACDESVVVSQ